MTVKIAVGAFGLTKWPVNIEPKAPVAPIIHENNPAQKPQQRGHGG